MRAPGFVEGAAVAFAAAVGGGAAMFAFAGLVAGPLLASIVIIAVAFGYVLYLLMRSGTRAGKISAVLAWVLMTCVTMTLGAPMFVQLCVQVGFVWLLRVFCIHRSVLPALLDLGLCALSVVAMLWAVERTGSVFIAIWCLLLVQAAYVAIPHRTIANRNGAARRTDSSSAGSDERFEHAHRTADAALRRLAATR